MKEICVDPLEFPCDTSGERESPDIPLLGFYTITFKLREVSMGPGM